MSVEVERPIAVLLVLVAIGTVACTVAVGVRSRLSDKREFIEISEPLHKDPVVADHLARQLTNDLYASKAITPDKVLDVRGELRQAIMSEEFAPAWRSVLTSSHDQAFRGKPASTLRLSHAVPSFGAGLEERSLASQASVSRTQMGVLSGSYVAELRSVVKLLRLVVFVGVPGLIVVTVFCLRRTRNRYRAAGLLSATALGAAVVVFALLPMLAGLALSAVVGGDSLALAKGAVEGVLPSIRILLVGLAIVAATLMVASRLEEVRVTPFVGSNHRRTHRRGSRRRPSRSAARPAEGAPVDLAHSLGDRLA